MNERNTELIEYVFDWERKVYAAYKAGTLPERAFTKSTSACKYCPVKNVCWKDMKNETESYILVNVIYTSHNVYSKQLKKVVEETNS